MLPNGYKAFFKNRHFYNKNRSGGIAVIFHESLDVTSVETDCKFVLWVKIKGKALNSKKDIILGSVYVPPEDSVYYSNKAFEEIEIEMATLNIDENCYFCLCGDFNARTGTLIDYTPSPEKDFLPSGVEFTNPETFGIPAKRNNKDVRKPNNSGFELLQLCKNFDILIVNGRHFGDPDGELTFKGRSLIDYFVCSPPLFCNMTRFMVDIFNPMFSDGHNALVLSFGPDYTDDTPSMYDSNPDLVNTEQVLNETNTQNPPFRWDSNKKNDFSRCLEENAKINVILNKLENLPAEPDDNFDVGMINEIVDEINGCFDTAASSSGMKRCVTRKKSGNKSRVADKSGKWYNAECADAKRQFEFAKRRYRNFRCDFRLAEMKRAAKDYKRVMKKAKNEFDKRVVNELNRTANSDPKKFWSILNCKKKAKNSDSVSVQEFYDHFVHLNETEADDSISNDDDNFVADNLTDTHVILDREISDQEVFKAIRQLKNCKASGPDNILNEMLKFAPNNMVKVIVKLFNVVLRCGHVPDTWGIGVIKPIFKNKGDVNNPDNYRGISLVSCLGKLFTSILNTRLTEFLDSGNGISEIQAGFRKNYSTTDHIFLLKSIIEIYLCAGRRLFCCFVDYRKAFDSIWRVALWRKLMKHGIKGRVLTVIQNLYKISKSCVMHNGEKSEYFASKVGVRQGENLSPLLFAIFLNDIEEFFSEHGCKSLSLIEKLDRDARGPELDAFLKLFILLYADDTVLLADDESELQRLLDCLENYCVANKLSVNGSKTKVMVFCRSKARLRNLPEFRYGNTVLDIVEEYTYLGVLFYWNGSFNKHKKMLHDKACRAMYAVVQKGLSMDLDFELFFKLFDACVSPILLYGVEVWGYENLDIIEKVHTKFMKIILKTSKFSRNTCLYGELGRFPLYIVAYQRMLGFWYRTMKGNEKKLSNIMYKILVNLHVRDKHSSPWLMKIRNVLEGCGLNFVWTNQANCTLSIAYISSLVKRTLQDQYIQSWNERITTDDDFVSLRIFKNDFGFEDYLSVLPRYLVFSMAEFRIGSPSLDCNNRRNLQFPRHERLCTKCNRQEVCDEFHFLFQCSLLDEIRLAYIPRYYRIRPNAFKMETLLSTNQRAVLLKVAKFVFKGLKIFKQNYNVT